MGEIELNIHDHQFIIHSNIITYGNAATTAMSYQIADEIETMWNEPAGTVLFHNEQFNVVFKINAWFQPAITPLEIYQNPDPGNNYFRIEEFVNGNISFVDGINSNSGYFKLENLYKGSTTAAHEYGHTLGLDHPHLLDLRGQGVPGIMCPRGTLVDPQFQYDSSKPAGVPGGTMHPMFRKVLKSDIENLKIPKSAFQQGKAILGEFTSIYHPNHA